MVSFTGYIIDCYLGHFLLNILPVEIILLLTTVLEITMYDTWKILIHKHLTLFIQFYCEYGTMFVAGSHPNVDDGEVNRTVCFATNTDQCVVSYGISVKNCSGYFVYYLKKTKTNSEGYCFG